jgi:acetyl esterase/lipase
MIAPMSDDTCKRRDFLKATVGCIAPFGVLKAQSAVTHPVVSEEACPLQIVEPIGADSHRGLAVLRKPPGTGPFPAIVWLHPGITTYSLARLQSTARDLATPSRFLAAGYVLVASTYRSRDVDLQTSASVDDCLAVVKFVRGLPYVDSRSVIVFGCSGGGDLALEVAVREKICAAIAEEPASVLMSGVFNNSSPKKGDRFTPGDSFYLLEKGKQYYTAEFQKTLRAKIDKIACPILIVQGDVDRRQIPINRFNADVLIPELRTAKKHLVVNTYPEQGHCFFAGDGLPRAPGAPVPASSLAAAVKAFQDCDAFCRLHLRTAPRAIDVTLVQQKPFGDGPITP